MSVFRPTYKDKKTGEVKQSATWWYGFIYAGKRYRESAKTLAEAREKSRKLDLERQFTTGKKAKDPRLLLPDAIGPY